MRRINQNYDPSTTSSFIYRRTRKVSRKPGEGMEVVDCYESGDIWWRIVISSDNLYGIQIKRPETGRYCSYMINGMHTFTHDLVALRILLKKLRSMENSNA